MTPSQYLQVLREQERIKDLADAVIFAAQKKVKRPKNLRSANATDIVVGNVIWARGDGRKWFWNIVEEVLCPRDDWKAYCADDGSRYGLLDAFVEVKH